MVDRLAGTEWEGFSGVVVNSHFTSAEMFQFLQADELVRSLAFDWASAGISRQPSMTESDRKESYVSTQVMRISSMITSNERGARSAHVAIELSVHTPLESRYAISMGFAGADDCERRYCTGISSTV